MKYNRIFCFGCSYTDYLWPTWSDILKKDLDVPVYNLGLSGIGNRAIFSKIIENDLKFKFSDTDLIIVVWSSWTREDRYINNKWINYGNVLNNDFYDNEFLTKYWDWENDIINNSTCIIATNKLYSNIINGSMTPIENPEDPYTSNEKNKNHIVEKNKKNLLEYYLPFLPVMNYFDLNGNSRFNDSTDDQHPDIKHHQWYVEKFIYPVLGQTIKDTTVQDIIKFADAAESEYSKIKNLYKVDRQNLYKLWSNGNWNKE